MEKSISGQLNKTEWKGYLINCLKFTAPGLAAFFGQLKLGVSWQVALITAALVLYGNLSDFFGKLNQGN